MNGWMGYKKKKKIQQSQNKSTSWNSLIKLKFPFGVNLQAASAQCSLWREGSLFTFALRHAVIGKNVFTFTSSVIINQSNVILSLGRKQAQKYACKQNGRLCQQPFNVLAFGNLIFPLGKFAFAF